MATDDIVTKRSVAGWWIFGLVLVVLAIAVLTALSYADIIFRTKVERKTYEESYQYKAGQREQIAIMRAQLAEIDSQLLDPKLPPETRRHLTAQQAAIRVRLNAALQR